jgi:hypothetical protein
VLAKQDLAIAGDLPDAAENSAATLSKSTGRL